MLCFAVFHEGESEFDISARNAYLFGPDAIPVEATLSSRDGLIRGEKANDDAAGLALQYSLQPAVRPDGETVELGSMMLRTCLLPSRPHIYLLSLELARHRIMLFLNKLEDWGLFDLPADHPIMVQFEQARAKFTKAVVTHRSGETDSRTRLSASADTLAKEALSLAVDAGEQLAAVDSERQLPRRVSGEFYQVAVDRVREHMGLDAPPPGVSIKIPDTLGVRVPDKPLVGCAVNTARFDDASKNAILKSCDFMSIPMRWVDMEPTEGRYSFGNTDRWIEWAVRTAKLPIVGGPLLDFRPSSVPEWLYIWEHDYDTLRELVYDHVRHIVTRYRRTIGRWTIVSGLHVNRNFTLKLEQIMDLTRMGVLMIRKLHPSAKVQIEICQPWGEYHAEHRKSIPPQLYTEMISQAGIAVDAIALRVHFGHVESGSPMRDLMAFSDMLDRYASMDKPLTVSALSVPSRCVGTGPEEQEYGGYWHAPWTAEGQAEWMKRAMTIAASKPYVQSVCWHELSDSSKTSLGEGLLTGESQPRPGLEALVSMREALRDGRVPLVEAPS